jgi:Bacteriophage HK97-gp10, putative tail-component
VAEFVPDEEGLRELFEGPNGHVAKVLARAAVLVESQAKLNATGAAVEGARNPEGRGPRVRTGRLRSSITWVLSTDALGLYARVGTPVRYGYYLETGLVNGATYPFLKPALSVL